MNVCKKWILWVLVITAVLMALLAGATVLIDPYFHYGAPINGLSYELSNQRYQNDGIIKHFSYDAMITGSSMTENFKTSQLDSLFDVQSIKVTYSGGSWKEINDCVALAVKSNPDLKLVVRGLDYGRLLEDKDTMRYAPSEYPTYLYDDVFYNDVHYLLNKEVFLNGTVENLLRTWKGDAPTSFDAYSNWNHLYSFGKDAVLADYVRPETLQPMQEMTDFTKLEAHVEQNILKLAQENPQINFYLFLTPYSIVYWDYVNQTGEIGKLLQAEQHLIEMLIPYENIHLFSFLDATDITCDLNNYKDIAHYSEEINSYILQAMSTGKHRLTQENYRAYCDFVRDFYTAYDYDSLFSSQP